MKKIIGFIIATIIVWFLSWLIGGLVLMASIHSCLFIHTVAVSLGVAELSFVNYANASLVISILISIFALKESVNDGFKKSRV
jgi:putative Ca2+/H+ antiporter (TMEM165/GDT1 family)